MLPLHEAIPLAQANFDASTFVKWKCSLVLEMARLSRLIHDRFVFHKDLYLCHFYIHVDDTGQIPPNWTKRLIVIDLHRLARHRTASLWWKVKDLAQLLYSSEVSGVTSRDRLAFWRAYRNGLGSQWLARLIRWKWRLYRRHNEKRKLAKQ